MATNFIQKGDTLKYSNGTGSDIASGDLVLVGSIFGVALVDIANGASGALAMGGVFTLDAINTAAISQGAPVYQDTDTGKCSPTAEDQKYIGIAWTAKAETGTTVAVKIGGYHPIINLIEDV